VAARLGWHRDGIRSVQSKEPGMPKQNCWELKRCGREPGGPRAEALGVCRAITAACTDGMNGGLNGGRVCWAVAGTLNGDKKRHCSSTFDDCLECDFFRMVAREEGARRCSAATVVIKVASALQVV